MGGSSLEGSRPAAIVWIAERRKPSGESNRIKSQPFRAIAIGVDLKSTAIDTSHALRTSERATQFIGRFQTTHRIKARKDSFSVFPISIVQVEKLDQSIRNSSFVSFQNGHLSVTIRELIVSAIEALISYSR